MHVHCNLLSGCAQGWSFVRRCGPIECLRTAKWLGSGDLGSPSHSSEGRTGIAPTKVLRPVAPSAQGFVVGRLADGGWEEPEPPEFPVTHRSTESRSNWIIAILDPGLRHGHDATSPADHRTNRFESAISEPLPPRSAVDPSLRAR